MHVIWSNDGAGETTAESRRQSSGLPVNLCLGLSFFIFSVHIYILRNTTAFQFLAGNGYRLEFQQAEAVAAVEQLAAGVLSETQFADWIRQQIELR